MNNRIGNTLIWVIIIVLVVVAAVSFYAGTAYVSSTAPQPLPVTVAATTTAPTVVQAGAEYYSNPSQWQTYTDTSAGYSIAYPIDFQADEPNSVAPSTDWLANNVAQAPGIKTFTLTIPAAFEPQTNFVDATLTVGYSQNNKAIANCLIAQNGEATSSTQTVNNAAFTVYTMSNPGAGNLYDTTSYRTTHAGACYAVEYTVHSAELGNFPSQYGLQQFDESQVDAVMSRIVGTFTFL